MINRREFGLQLGLLLSLGVVPNLLADSLDDDFLIASFKKYFEIYGVSNSNFSFDAKVLALENKTLSLNLDRFCLMNYRLNSKQKRFSIITRKAKKELNSIASHGINTGNNLAFDFSNTSGSFKSSLGIYVTGTHYVGHFGPSIILYGVSSTNNLVFERRIVLHGADYCSQDHINKYGFLGRSLGCIALPKKEMISAYQLLVPGTLIFTDAPSPKKPKEVIVPPTPEEIVENRIIV